MFFYTIISLYFLSIAVAVIFWAAHIRSLNGAKYTHIAVLLSFAVCIYILGYTLELNATATSQILFWNNIEYFGIPYVSALWLLVALIYTGNFSRHKKLLLLFIFTIPVITMILRFTNHFHALYFSATVFIDQNGKLLFGKTPGPWMIVQTLHSILMLCIAFGLILYDDFFKNKEKSIGKTGLMMIAFLFAFAGLTLTVTKPFAYIIDYMALCLPASCLMVILAIWRYDFLEARSMARSKAFEAGRDAIILLNEQNKIIDYNKNAKDLLGKLGLPISNGYLPALFGSAPALLESLGKKETSIIQLNVNNKEQYYEISTKNIDDIRPFHGWMKTIHDITEIYELNKNLKGQALMDELSGLSNRRAFMQMGKEIIRNAVQGNETVYLLMMDLDHFKQINDQYGHQAGDEIIQWFGTQLKNAFGPHSLIARLGGEEFGLLLVNYNDEEIEQKAKIIAQNIAQSAHRKPGGHFHVTVSIGIAKKTNTAQGLEDLMHLADMALYTAKDNGRNGVAMLT